MTNFQLLINNSIKNLRNIIGLSQEKFSEKCGINTEGYRNLEHNRYMPKSTTIDKICKAYNLTPIELLKLGLEKPNESLIDDIQTKLEGLNDHQLKIVSDFVTLIKKY